jgi:xylulokinase
MLPGLLYGDLEGRPAPAPGPGGVADPGPGMPDAEGFLRWAHALAPEAKGYWPCQAVATHALTGVPAVDTGVTASMGSLHAGGEWNAEMLAGMGVLPAQLPVVVPMCAAGGTLPGTDTVFTGGSIDAMCDQVVAGADSPGDVHVIFGATLIVWVVADSWVQVPGLISFPHTTPDRFVIGGPSNAGALFMDWARTLLRGTPRPGPGREKLDTRLGSPSRVPIWLPYVRGERTPFDDHTLRSNLYGLDIASGPEALERAAFEASGFVIQRIIDRAGVRARRIVASGGGSRVTAWMAAVADATDLPVDALTVPDGAARGAAFFARMAAGLETTLNDSSRWASVGRRIEPDPVWTAAARSRYERFCELGTGA